MKISGSQVESLLQLYTERARGQRRGRISRVSSRKGSFVLSPEVRGASGLKDRLRDIPVLRRELVETIREHVERGQYHPDGVEVARKMLYREVADFIISERGCIDPSQ